MADVVSAGTIVGAVLETAGYVTQDRVLTDFNVFLSSAGAYFYMIAAVGALFSVTLFGSYRMARYLLIGPALFWVLITERTPIDGAFWALGKNAPRSINGVFERELETFRPDGAIKVATPFYYFIQTVSDLVNNLSRMILKYHDNQDYLFLDRRYALDVLINSFPEKPRLVGILWENVFANCEEMMQISMALSHTDISDTLLNLWDTKAQKDPDENQVKEAKAKAKAIRDRRDALNARFKKVADETKTELTAETREFMAAYEDKYDFTGQFQLKATTKDELAYEKLSCGQLWEVAKDAIREDSQVILDKVKGELSNTSTLYNATENISGDVLLCRALGDKLVSYKPGAFRTAPDDCDLVEVVSAFMLRNMILDLPRSNQASLIKNKSHYYASSRLIRVDLKPGETEARSIRFETARFRYNENCGGTNSGEGCYEVLINPGARAESEDWRSYHFISSVGHLDVAYFNHQNYQANYLQQSIFTWALQLPYFQGCILYFLAIAYPFMAILVVAPGHAVRFLNLPLFWIWVKSWDIGFALVMVLEKILWQILPNSKVPYDVFSNTEKYKLPDIISSAFAIDPSFDIHAHYNYIAMALFAIPPITGYVVMKGKSSVLASFTDAPRDDADEAGSIAQGRYGMGVMNDMISGMKRAEGQVLRGARWLGKNDNGRGWNAAGYAVMAGGVDAVKAADSALGGAVGRGGSGLSGLFPFFKQPDADGGIPKAGRGLGSRDATRGALQNLSGGLKDAMSMFSKIRNAEINADSYRELAYGSYKEHRKRMGAVFAAMDAFGEHELAHFLEGRQELRRDIDLWMIKARAYLDAGEKGLNAIGDSRIGNKIRDIMPAGNAASTALRVGAGIVAPVLAKEIIYETDALKKSGMFGPEHDGIPQLEWMMTEDGLGFRRVIQTPRTISKPPVGSGIREIPKQFDDVVHNLLSNTKKAVDGDGS